MFRAHVEQQSFFVSEICFAKAASAGDRSITKHIIIPRLCRGCHCIGQFQGSQFRYIQIQKEFFDMLVPENVQVDSIQRFKKLCACF